MRSAQHTTFINTLVPEEAYAASRSPLRQTPRVAGRRSDDTGALATVRMR
ncbi:MAG TPA: hypothetical protein VFP31_11505 [Gaiellaceae bacterium]|nr:hypothetical protein [Gaiellaceae bacterium]